MTVTNIDTGGGYGGGDRQQGGYGMCTRLLLISWTC
jgi:hypothetical protein